jgi:hypothetical protein
MSRRVSRQIRAHHGQPEDAEVSLISHMSSHPYRHLRPS